MAKQESNNHDNIIYGQWHVRYKYSVGKVAGVFFDGLKQKKILATHCIRCGVSYLPPRAYCERCFESCGNWIEAAHEGVIEAATIVTAKFENLPEPPYAIAYVRLDGVGTAMINFVRDLDLSNVKHAAESLKPGTRVRVQFINEPQGRITDFHYVLPHV
ncbi:MAG: Zn-ribbon domain-containing OB-fold protein [Candidatus Acidiferrales bacterium]